MNKQAYLSDPHVSGFTNFLLDFVTGEENSFFHEYEQQKPKQTVRFNSFKGAYDNYLWNKLDFENTRKVLKGLSTDLERALDQPDQERCLISALKILEWGDVYRGSVGWLASRAESNTLVESLREAIAILTGDDDELAARFGKDRASLRSDSGMTKVYALAGQACIIYDDRVGAALALFVKEYLLLNRIALVPPTLAFMCQQGKKNGRNPSDSQYKFPPKAAGQQHALSNIRANWIIEAIAQHQRFDWQLPESDRVNTNQTVDRMRAIEAALFMIGYAVCGSRVIGTRFNVARRSRAP